MSVQKDSNDLSFTIVTVDSRRRTKETSYYVADVLMKVATDVKKDTGSESLQLSEAYLRFFSRETGIKFMDIVEQALACGISVTMDDPIISLAVGEKKLTSEQEAILIFIIRDETSTSDMKHWAEDILIRANMDTAYFSLRKANLSGVSCGTFDMEDLMQEAYEAFLLGIRAKNFNPLTGGRLSTYLSSKGAYALADKLRKDELFDHHGATRYEQIALRDIALAKEEGKEPDVEKISKHANLMESKIREFIARDLCLPSDVSLHQFEGKDRDPIYGDALYSNAGYAADYPSVDNDFDELMIARDFLEKVDYALHHYLTEEQRKIFLLKNGDDDYSVRAISELLGITGHEVNKQYREAIDRLFMAFKYIYNCDASDYIL